MRACAATPSGRERGARARRRSRANCCGPHAPGDRTPRKEFPLSRSRPRRTDEQREPHRWPPLHVSGVDESVCVPLHLLARLYVPITCVCFDVDRCCLLVFLPGMHTSSCILLCVLLTSWRCMSKCIFIPMCRVLTMHVFIQVVVCV